MPNKSKNIKVTDKFKPWNKKKTKKIPYEIESEEKEKAFLIICEGANTEPEYFKSFPVRTAEVESYGLGTTKTKLVNYVTSIAKEDNDKDTEYWVVFDMDIRLENTTAQREDYENAIRLAGSKGIHVAYSNDSFELWFLLHYQYFENQWTRHQYYQRLSEIWDCNYEKAGKKISFCKNIYKRLQEDENASQVEAISRAEKLVQYHEWTRLAEQNPVTTIHRLVEKLNEHI